MFCTIIVPQRTVCRKFPCILSGFWHYCSRLQRLIRQACKLGALSSNTTPRPPSPTRTGAGRRPRLQTGAAARPPAGTGRCRLRGCRAAGSTAVCFVHVFPPFSYNMYINIIFYSNCLPFEQLPCARPPWTGRPIRLTPPDPITRTCAQPRNHWQTRFGHRHQRSIHPVQNGFTAGRYGP